MPAKPLRWATLTAALTITVGMIAGCGTSGQGNTDATKITVLTSSDPKIVNSVQATLGPEFTKRTGITVTVEQAGGPTWTDVDSRIQSDITAGNRPDVALVGTNSVRSYADSKVAQPLDEVMAQSTFDSSQYSASLLKVGQLDGKTVGVPYAISMLVLYINDDAFRKAGLDPEHPPRTFSELKTAAAKIVDTKAARYGVTWAYDTDSNWQLQNMLFSAGGSMMDPADQHVTINQPPATRVLQFWRDLVQAGVSTPMKSADMTAAFTRGDLGMMLQTSAQTTAISAGVSFPIRTDTLPVPDGGTLALPPGGGSAVVLAKDSQVQKSAWTVVQELIGATGQTALVKGSGYTSANQAAIDDPQHLASFLAQQPLRAAATTEIANLVPWYQFPGSRGEEAQDKVRDAVLAALNGSKPVQQALNEAAEAVTDLVVR